MPPAYLMWDYSHVADCTNGLLKNSAFGALYTDASKVFFAHIYGSKKEPVCYPSMMFDALISL